MRASAIKWLGMVLHPMCDATYEIGLSVAARPGFCS